jgi:hypothetical protein
MNVSNSLNAPNARTFGQDCDYCGLLFGAEYVCHEIYCITQTKSCQAFLCYNFYAFSDREERAMNDESKAAEDEGGSQQIAPAGTVHNSATGQIATERQLQEAEQKIETRMSAFERSMIRLTWAAVIISILSGLVFTGQLYVMITGGSATDKLVEYSKVQANAGSDQADAAQQFSDTAEDINGRMSDAVNELKSANDNSRLIIRNAQNSFREEQRAWVGVASTELKETIEVGKRPSASIRIQNTGKTPAIHVYMDVQGGVLCGAFPKKPPYQITGPGSHVMLIPNGPPAESGHAPFTVDPFTENDISFIKRPDCGLYHYARITYLDIFKRPHWRHYCSTWLKESPTTFGNCASYNDGDEDYPDGKEP